MIGLKLDFMICRPRSMWCRKGGHVLKKWEWERGGGKIDLHYKKDKNEFNRAIIFYIRQGARQLLVEVMANHSRYTST